MRVKKGKWRSSTLVRQGERGSGEMLLFAVGGSTSSSDGGGCSPGEAGGWCAGVTLHPRGYRQKPLGQGGSFALAVNASDTVATVSASGAHPSKKPLKNERTLGKKLQG